MNRFNIKGFSLIELMVVIAIVAVLSAIAVPAYKDYVLRTKVVKAMNNVTIMANTLLSEYQRTGAFPASFNYNGVSIAADSPTYTTVNDGGIYAVRYLSSATFPSSEGVLLQFSLSGLEGMPTYTAPTDGARGGVGALIRFGIVNDNGTVKKGCGHWNSTVTNNAWGDTTGVPYAYLPPGCRCINVSGFVNSSNTTFTCS